MDDIGTFTEVLPSPAADNTVFCVGVPETAPCESIDTSTFSLTSTYGALAPVPCGGVDESRCRDDECDEEHDVAPSPAIPNTPTPATKATRRRRRKALTAPTMTTDRVNPSHPRRVSLTGSSATPLQTDGLDGSSGRTLEQVGVELGITRERVRQLETRALRELRHVAPALELYLRA